MVERYDPIQVLWDNSTSRGEMRADEDGEYVKHEDYASLSSQHAEAVARVAALEAERKPRWIALGDGGHVCSKCGEERDTDYRIHERTCWPAPERADESKAAPDETMQSLRAERSALLVEREILRNQLLDAKRERQPALPASLAEKLREMVEAVDGQRVVFFDEDATPKELRAARSVAAVIDWARDLGVAP